MEKNVVTKWRQEVGISATANLARFADPRLHVINVENDNTCFGSHFKMAQQVASSKIHRTYPVLKGN